MERFFFAAGSVIAFYGDCDFTGDNEDRSIEIFRQRFSSARELTFILVGSFDPAAIKPLRLW